MGDKGKKDKDKGQKQHAEKNRQEQKAKLDKQPKRVSKAGESGPRGAVHDAQHAQGWAAHRVAAVSIIGPT